VHGRDLVILDLNLGEYELFAGLGDHLALSASRRFVRCEDHDILTDLDAMGLLASGGSGDARSPPALPTRTALFGPSPPLYLADRVWMTRGWFDMLRRYHGRSFKHLLNAVHDRRAPSHADCSKSLQRKAAVFDRLSVWIPFQGDCLYRCFMLLRLLGDEGSEVDWVFGVRTWPFLAHCWLQWGDLVLTDDAARLVMFSPIFSA